MGQIIVVEGKSDTAKLKIAYSNIITFETSGLGFDEKKIQELKKLAIDNEIIVFTDPDGPGEIIRQRVIKNIEGAKHAYLKNEKAISKDMKNVGIEHASVEDIKYALDNLYEVKEYSCDYTIEDLIDFGIFNSKIKRMEFCNDLNIAYGNNKKIIKQLNMFGISIDQIKEIKGEDGTSKY